MRVSGCGGDDDELQQQVYSHVALQPVGSAVVPPGDHTRLSLAVYKNL